MLCTLGQPRNGGLKAFTLIELSIVLVIIGLIAGGVLVGQSLVEAARLRAAISQIEEFDTAVNTFRTKYNGIPGDISNGAVFGFGARTASGAGYCNGNKIIENRGSSGDTVSVRGDEIVLFWNDLTRANLISEGLDASLDSTDWACYNDATCTPKSELNNAWINIYQRGSIAHYLIQSLPTLHFLGPTAGATPQQAMSWDEKIDDGSPLTGKIHMVRGFNVAIDEAPSATGCIVSTAAYNVLPDYQDAVLCAVAIRMGYN